MYALTGSFRWQLVVQTFDGEIVRRSRSLHAFQRPGTQSTKDSPVLSLLPGMAAGTGTQPQPLAPLGRSGGSRYLRLAETSRTVIVRCIGRFTAVIRRWVGPNRTVIPRQTVSWPGRLLSVGRRVCTRYPPSLRCLIRRLL